MPENLPAVPEPSRLPEVARVDTDSWVDIMRPMIALADRIYDTEFVPKGLRGSAPATAAAMLYGREVGLPPMTALNMTHVVEGKPGLSAEGMRAVVLAAGHEIEFVESTGAICTMRARRRGSDTWTSISWTIDAARQAGLANKNVWKSYPRVMLQARCTTELCRMVFPDVIHGFRSVEELEDMEPGDGEATGFGEPTAPSTKVSRARKTTKKTTAALPAAPAPAAAPRPAGPPLPGEPGFDQPTPRGGATEQAAGASGDDSPGSQPEGAGKDSEDAPAAAPETVDPSADVDEPVNGEVVHEPPAEEPSGDDKNRGPRKASRAQQRMMHGQFGALGIDDDEPGGREERLHITSVIVGRAVESSSDLSAQEMSTLIDTLGRVRDRVALNALLDEIEAGR